LYDLQVPKRTLQCCPYCESKRLEAFESGPAFVGRCQNCRALFKAEVIAEDTPVAETEPPRSSYEWPAPRRRT
jgi:hypothetical protein